MTRPARVAALGAALSLSTVLSGCGFLGIGGDEPGDIQVYSARHYDLEDAFVEFEEETGLSVDFIYGDDTELLERLKAEGDETPADLFVTVDAGNLWNAARQDELAPLESPELEEAVPEDLRDPQGRWFGLAMRARTVSPSSSSVTAYAIGPSRPTSWSDSRGVCMFLNPPSRWPPRSTRSLRRSGCDFSECQRISSAPAPTATQ